MVNMPRRRPLDMLGDPSAGGDLPVGAETASVGMPGDVDPSTMGALGDPMMGSTDQIPTPELEGMVGGDMMGGEEALPPEEEDEVAALEAALEDPTIDEATKAQIRQMLAMAARQSLAGVGGEL